MSRHRESPLRRVNPSGKAVWVARYTGPDGRRRSAGSFALKREAQDAIDAAYDLPVAIDSVGGYFHRWPALHPRATRAQATNEHRVSRALDVKIQGRALQAWPYRDLRRRHALILVDDLLREQGRSALGATHVLRALSLMTEDAITDEVVDVNAFRGVTIRASDPRVTKPPRIDTELLFPTLTGRLWRESNFYRDVSEARARSLGARHPSARDAPVLGHAPPRGRH